MKLSKIASVAAVLGLASIYAPSASATEDEIQVYNAEINEPGHWSLEVHNNYAIKAQRSPDHPGGMVPNGALNGTPEFAYGLKDWWELGLYLPYAVTRDGDVRDGGFKLRTLFVSPNAKDRSLFYGLNFELGWSPRLFSENYWNLEVRPILGVRSEPFEFIINPIVDLALSGDNRRIEFAPAVRAAYSLSPQWAIGLEHYSNVGPFDNVPRFAQQDQMVFAVVDYSGEEFGVNFGIGRGYTSGAEDSWIAKMILEHDF
jgi:hypothetical protein